MRWQAFFPVIPELEKEWHLYALDLIGHGQSGRAGSYRIQDFVPDTASFIKDCINEPAVVFGHSLGGMIAIMVAAFHPELVKALIIGDSAISVEFLKEFAESQKDKTVWWRELAKTKDIGFIMSELKKELIPVPGREGLVPAYQVYGEDHPSFRFGAECFSRLDPETLTANIDHFDETYAEYRTERLFPKIQCPVLIIQANPELGGLERDEDVAKALSLLPKAQHVKINHVGHWLHLQDKEAVLKAIAQWYRDDTLVGYFFAFSPLL